MCALHLCTVLHLWSDLLQFAWRVPGTLTLPQRCEESCQAVTVRKLLDAEKETTTGFMKLALPFGKPRSVLISSPTHLRMRQVGR